jgi:Helix-turn-helix domain
VSRRRSLVVVWRDAIGDCDLDSTAKLVAYQLTRWMDARGFCYPSREEIAAKASLSVRAVDLAIRRLESQGWLLIERSRGRQSNRYKATLSPTANEIRRSEWGNRASDAPNSASDAPNGERRSPEDVLRRRKRSAPTDAAPLSGSASSGPLREEWPPEDDCQGCRVRAVLVGPDFRYCRDCQAAIDALREEGAT